MPTNPHIPIAYPQGQTVFTCEIPVTYTPEDNQTYIKREGFNVVECTEIPLGDSADFWNCNVCGSDEKYEQPVLETDTVREQFRINNNTFKEYRAFLFDGNGDVIEDTNGITLNFFADGFVNQYMNVTLDVSNIPSDCFYYRIFAFEALVDEGDLETCVDVKLSLGRGPKEAAVLCLFELYPDLTQKYSEMFRKTNDECENTLLLEGEYPYYDCNGNYYGVQQTGDNNTHTLSMRIPATIEKTEYNFEESIIFNTKRSSKQLDTFLLRTEKLPPYVVAKLALIFNSKTITIDGVDYKGGKKLSKNFEEGRMWIINTTLTQECDLDFLCS